MPRHDLRRSVGALLAFALTGMSLLVPVSPAHAQTDANWSDSFGQPGTNGEVLCSTVWHGHLVVGGTFGSAGSVNTGPVALWDGATWSRMGDSFDGSVYALAVWNDSLYAAGAFYDSGWTIVTSLARWTGTDWVAVGGGINGTGLALLATPAGLVVGGAFDATGTLGGTNNVARWNGTAWSTLGSGLDAPVHGLALHGGQVAAVGEFGGYVSLYNGSFWSTVGGGLPDGSSTTSVTAVISHGGALYVGGSFDVTPDADELVNVARWDGSQWHSLDGGVDGSVAAFEEWNGNLYLGGSFMNPVFHLAMWDGTEFICPGDVYGVGWYGGDYVNTLAAGASKLYVSGILTLVAPSTYGSNVFAFDGAAYSSLGVGNGFDNEVRSISKWNGSIVVGGTFDRSYDVGGLNGIARWTGSRWAPLGTGFQTAGGFYILRVNGLSTFGTDLVACGQFATAGGTTVNNIAHWNGTSWSGYGSGFASETYAATVYANELWAVGGYQELQGNTLGGVWKWSGGAWHSMANDVTGFALTTWNGKLILGGSFSTVAGVPARCVAQWDGSHWNPLGAGLDGTVISLAVYDGDLYAAGEFYHSGLSSVVGIARWNGTQWVAVGGPVETNYAAFGLSVGAGALWASGSWTRIGTTTGLYGMARWDGSAWTPLGSGTYGVVRAVYVDGTDVWAGGMFGDMGQKITGNISKWTTTVAAAPATPARPLALELAPPSPNPSRDAMRIEFSLPARAEVRLDVVDVSGRLVAGLARGPMDAGRHAVSWDGTSNAGSRAAAGVYWVTLSAGDRRLAKRLVRMR